MANIIATTSTANLSDLTTDERQAFEALAQTRGVYVVPGCPPHRVVLSASTSEAIDALLAFSADMFR